MSPSLAPLYTKLYNDIVELRNTFLLPVNTGVLTAADQQHHDAIFRSEFRELANANTRVLTLDGLVDSVVTLMGRCVHQGMRPFGMLMELQPGPAFLMAECIQAAHDLEMNFEGAWDEIHRSNLSKVCPDEADFKKTKAHYAKLGVAVYGEETPKGIVVKCSETVIGKDGNDYPKGKFLKSLSYTKPDLTPFI